MNVTLKPELQTFVEAKIQSGEYATPEAVVEAGIARLMDDDDLDDETLQVIAEGEAQLERGEGIPLKEAFARLRQKLKDR